MPTHFQCLIFTTPYESVDCPYVQIFLKINVYFLHRFRFESNGEKIPYELKWAALQPNNFEGEDFVYFKFPDNTFYDGDAEFKVELICEKL